MITERKEVTEYDDYKYEFIGKDTPELRAQAKAAREEAIKFADELKKKHDTMILHL